MEEEGHLTVLICLIIAGLRKTMRNIGEALVEKKFRRMG